jgi:hypothetical protein
MTTIKKKKQKAIDGVFAAAAKTVGAFAGRIAAAVGVTARKKAEPPKPRKAAVPTPRKGASQKSGKKGLPKRPIKASRKATRKSI